MKEKVIETVKFENVFELRNALSAVDEMTEENVSVEQADSRQARAFEVVEREEDGVKTLAIRFVPWVAPDSKIQKRLMEELLKSFPSVSQEYEISVRDNPVCNGPESGDEKPTPAHPALRKIVESAIAYPGGPDAYAKAFNDLTPEQVRPAYRRRQDGHATWCTSVQYAPGPCDCDPDSRTAAQKLSEACTVCNGPVNACDCERCEATTLAGKVRCTLAMSHKGKHKWPQP